MKGTGGVPIDSLPEHMRNVARILSDADNSGLSEEASLQSFVIHYERPVDTHR